MDELDRKIRDAEIMLRSREPEQQERGREKLREVVRDGDGSTAATRARHMLSVVHYPTTETTDPELDQLMSLWPSIQGFSDHRLVSFLKSLEDYPGMAVSLRSDVTADLQRWMVDAIPFVGKEAQPSEISALNEFVNSVRGLAAYEVLPEFAQLRDVLFSLRFQETATLVDEALQTWDLDKAWRLVDELNPLPEAFKTRVERLDSEIYKVDGLRRRVENLLGRLPPLAPMKWSETRVQAELLQQIVECISNEHIPEVWQSRLEAARMTLAEFIERFVRGQAMATVTVSQLQGFWTEYHPLTVKTNVIDFALEEDWFPKIMDSVASDLRREVARAQNPDELKTIVSNLRADLDGVPPSVVRHFEEYTSAIEQMFSSWKGMQDGLAFEFPLSSPGTLPSPAAWQDKAPQYATWIHRIETVLKNFKDETLSLSEQDYQDGMQLAEEILSKVPDHVLATKLKLESGRRISYYKLDQAILGWKLDLFFKLIELNDPGNAYAAIAVSRQPLIELQKLVQQNPLTDWRAAVDWWTTWLVTVSQLPATKPDVLLQALERQSDKRKKEWYAALDRLLQDNAVPEEYEAAAKSLVHEPESNLQTYQQELRRKATIGRIKQHIQSERFEDAELELTKLTSTTTDAEELRTKLAYAQARKQSSVAVAEFLSREWHNVRYLGEPNQILLDSLQVVWSENSTDSLTKLSQLLSRALSRSDIQNTVAPTTRQLVEWQSWLEIENSLIGNFSSHGVKQLADYLRTVEPGPLLDQRLIKLLHHWEKQNNNVMLAWAHQAFQPKSTVAVRFDQAADLLSRESDDVALEINTILAERSSLELKDLSSLNDSIKMEEEKWQSLNDYLGLYLAQNVTHRQPSPLFVTAKTSLIEVTRILTLFAQLEEADLRQEAARQTFADVDSKTRRLRNVASRERLLTELERLRPLTDLFSVGERIRETAEKCSSREPRIVLESGLFEKLANYVREVDGIFSTADARGGHMWRSVSADYESLIYREACIFRPLSDLPQLDNLAATLDSLNAEELDFTSAIELLENRDRQPKVAWGDTFDAESHLDYLQLIPGREPQSLKVYFRFDRARRDALKFILEARASLPHLPVWVREYLEKGVPPCGNGR